MQKHNVRMHACMRLSIAGVCNGAFLSSLSCLTVSDLYLGSVSLVSRVSGWCLKCPIVSGESDFFWRHNSPGGPVGVHCAECDRLSDVFEFVK